MCFMRKSSSTLSMPVGGERSGAGGGIQHQPATSLEDVGSRVRTKVQSRDAPVPTGVKFHMEVTRSSGKNKSHPGSPMAGGSDNEQGPCGDSSRMSRTHRLIVTKPSICRRRSAGREPTLGRWEVAGSGSVLGLRARAGLLRCGTFSRTF